VSRRHKAALFGVSKAMTELHSAAMEDPPPGFPEGGDRWAWAIERMTMIALLDTVTAAELHGLSHDEIRELVVEALSDAIELRAEALAAEKRGSTS